MSPQFFHRIFDFIFDKILFFVQNVEKCLNLFNDMSNFLEEDPPPELRERKYRLFKKKFRKICNYDWHSEEAKSIAKNRLNKWNKDWLTAIKIPGVNLTNNDTERDIRSVIPTRKLLGGHRTEDGAKYYAITQSFRLTWKRRGFSPFHKMTEKLSEINVCTTN